MTQLANYGKYKTWQFWKLHDLPIIELANFGNYMTSQVWKIQNLPILVITKLTTFGNNNTCRFWIQSKLPVLSQKWKLNPTNKNLECHYNRAGEFMPILESCL